MKKKLLPLAMLAGLSGTAGPARAVHVSSSALGDVMIYPYYSPDVNRTRNGYVEIVEQPNTVKVRMLEAAGAEVLDFNLYLSPIGQEIGL